MTKEEEEILEQLKKDKNYEQIFRQFGQKEFLNSVDKKYKKQDIKKLQKERRFEDIYVKYGEKTYNKYLRKFKQKEIEDVYGKRSFKALKGRIKLIGAALLTAAGVKYGVDQYVQPTLATANYNIQSGENYREESKKGYEELIQEYEKSIIRYAENINKLNLTDFETIMKVQEDMWASIEGYNDPEIDIEECFGLDIWSSKKGICRNMADDVARKLNAINPKYNARICTAYQKEKADVEEKVKVSRPIFELQDDKVDYEGISWAYPNYMNVEEMGYNHVVVLVDIENITLVVDPTTMFIGTFQNGKINILNVIPEQQDNMTKRSPWFDLYYRHNESIWDIPKEYVKSFLPTKLSKEEIEEKYGVEAQNAALDSANKKEQDYIYQSSKKEQSFKSSLQVNSEEDIYSVEEIINTYQKIMQTQKENITYEESRQTTKDYLKMCDSIEYYNDKKEEMLGTKILNSDMLLESKLKINVSDLISKVTDITCYDGYVHENETNNKVATQTRQESEVQDDLEEEL